MKRLVVTADDFGAAIEVNEAVEIAHRKGILTAASLMVAGVAAEDAVERARRLPKLGVGLHLVLVEGRPVLPPERLPDLVGPDGLFRTDMVRTGFAIAIKPWVRRQVELEIEVQFAAFAATGLALDHVNAHKHFHLHPVIAATILKVGRRYGIRAIRTPVEPRSLLNEVDPGAPRDPGAFWARRLQRQLRKEGMTVPDHVFGVAWSGAFTAKRLRGVLDRLPPGLTEIYAHPATGPYPGSAPGYAYAEELAALAEAPAPGDDVAPGRFADFVERGS